MKPVPADRDGCRHLFEAADRVMAVLEPIRQQINHLTRSASAWRDGRANDHDYYVQVRESLYAKLVDGLPVRRLLHDYMPADVFGIISELPWGELDLLDQRILDGTATDEDRRRHIEMSCQVIQELSARIERYVDEVLELQRRIIAGPGVDSVPVDPPTDSAVQAPEKPADPPSRRAARARSKNVTSLGMLGLGIDARQRWVAFDRHGTEWQHRGLLEPQPEPGRMTVLLTSFLTAGGSLMTAELVRIVSPAASNSQAAMHYQNRELPSLSKVRTWLRVVFELRKSADPIQYHKNPSTYRMMVTLGHVMSDDDGKPHFVPVDKQG